MPTVTDVEDIIRKDGSIVFLNDTIDALREAGWHIMSTGTFYRLFPVGSDNYVAIVTALEINKTKLKRRLRDRWMSRNEATTEIALYKLLATPEERAALSTRIDTSIRNTDEPIELRID